MATTTSSPVARHIATSGVARALVADQPHDPDRHAAALEKDDVDLAIVALSTALGVEGLPDDQARTVIAAWDEDADKLPARLRAWGSVPLAQPDPRDIDQALHRGRVGVTLPATALASPRALDRVGPLLERLADRGAPLFVHPGPSPPGTWLAFLTSYVAGLSDAWHAWVLHGRAHHPRLRVIFAALAGLAPLQTERLTTRVIDAPVQVALDDTRIIHDTSSYGPTAITATAGVVGRDALVYGSDWPYNRPDLPESQRGHTRIIGHALLQARLTRVPG